MGIGAEFAEAMLQREAEASVALDGETFSVVTPDQPDHLERLVHEAFRALSPRVSSPRIGETALWLAKSIRQAEARTFDDPSGVDLIDPQTPGQARLQMVHALHRAVYGDSWARPESPAEIWQELLGTVRALREAAGVDPDPDSPADGDATDDDPVAAAAVLANRIVYGPLTAIDAQIQAGLTVVTELRTRAEALVRDLDQATNARNALLAAALVLNPNLTIPSEENPTDD